jgi:hypothetical protein
MSRKKINLSSDDWSTLIVIILIIIFACFGIYSLFNPSKGSKSYGSDCDEEWDTHGGHHKICDREYDGYDGEPAGYDDYLESKYDEYENNYDEYDSKYEEYLESQYGD